MIDPQRSATPQQNPPQNVSPVSAMSQLPPQPQPHPSNPYITAPLPPLPPQAGQQQQIHAQTFPQQQQPYTQQQQQFNPQNFPHNPTSHQQVPQSYQQPLPQTYPQPGFQPQPQQFLHTNPLQSNPTQPSLHPQMQAQRGAGDGDGGMAPDQTAEKQRKEQEAARRKRSMISCLHVAAVALQKCGDFCIVCGRVMR